MIRDLARASVKSSAASRIGRSPFMDRPGQRRGSRRAREALLARFGERQGRLDPARPSQQSDSSLENAASKGQSDI